VRSPLVAMSHVIKETDRSLLLYLMHRHKASASGPRCAGR
jgi:hypothetical protein